MNPKLARLLTRLYPPVWRERYGEEFEALLEMGDGGVRTFTNSIWSAIREHIFPTRGGNMDQDPNSLSAMLKRPSAFIPVVMSIVALTMVLGVVAIGVAQQGHLVRDPDEGPVAHIFQLLMTVQMPIVLFFAIKWLGRAPRQTLSVLGLQVAAWFAGCAPVFFFHL